MRYEIAKFRSTLCGGPLDGTELDLYVDPQPGVRLSLLYGPRGAKDRAAVYVWSGERRLFVFLCSSKDHAIVEYVRQGIQAGDWPVKVVR